MTINDHKLLVKELRELYGKKGKPLSFRRGSGSNRNSVYENF